MFPSIQTRPWVLLAQHSCCSFVEDRLRTSSWAFVVSSPTRRSLRVRFSSLPVRDRHETFERVHPLLPVACLPATSALDGLLLGHGEYPKRLTNESRPSRLNPSFQTGGKAGKLWVDETFSRPCWNICWALVAWAMDTDWKSRWMPWTKNILSLCKEWGRGVAYLQTIIEFLHHIELGRFHHVLDMHILGGETSLARARNVTLTVDLLVIQIDGIREISLEIQLTIALQAFKAEFMVECIFNGTDPFGDIDQLLASPTSITRRGWRWCRGGLSR